VSADEETQMSIVIPVCRLHDIYKRFVSGRWVCDLCEAER
jgi:ribosomal protein L37AE/L43A